MPQAKKHYIIVQPNGQTFGGAANLTLPTQADGAWNPGQWHTQTDYAKGHFIAGHGFGVTRKPTKEWHQGAQCYEVEYADASGMTYFNGIYCGKIRLTRQVSVEELAKLKIFCSGQHAIQSGHCVIDGDAYVGLSGTARADVYGPNVSVTAGERAKIDVMSEKAGGLITAIGDTHVNVRSSHRESAMVMVEADGKVSVTLQDWGQYEITRKRVRMAGVDARSTLRVLAGGSAVLSIRAKASVTLHSDDVVVKIDRELCTADHL